MSVPKHREAAAARLKDASMRIDVAREGPVIRENQQRWLEALTDYCMALGDIQSFNNESIHEKYMIWQGGSDCGNFHNPRRGGFSAMARWVARSARLQVLDFSSFSRRSLRRRNSSWNDDSPMILPN